MVFSIAATNLLGFTTQTASRREVSTSALSLPRKLVGSDTVIHMRRLEAWIALSAKDVALLDFLRRSGRTSELSPEETIRRTIKFLSENGRFKRLLVLAGSEPPRVRAMDRRHRRAAPGEGCFRLPGTGFSNKGMLMTHSDIITMERGRRGGKPCVRGLRITVYNVRERLASGMTHPEILREFPYLTEEDIRACHASASDRKRKVKISNARSSSLMKPLSSPA